MVRVGVLAASGDALVQAFRDGLREEGLAEGADVSIVSRVANGDLTRLRALADELRQARAEVIVAIGAVTVRAARDAARAIPIIYTMVVDPVADGFAESLERPADDCTGITTFDPDQAETHVRLLRRLRPGIERVAIFGDTGVSDCLATANRRAFRRSGIAANVIGITGSRPDLRAAFASIADSRSQALVVLEHPANGACRTAIARLAQEHGLPSIFARDHADAGGLIAYGTSLRGATRRLPRQLHKVLAGSSPLALPIETFRAPELMVNPAAARALGVALSTDLLAD